jgi:hypothetical protein
LLNFGTATETCDCYRNRCCHDTFENRYFHDHSQDIHLTFFSMVFEWHYVERAYSPQPKWQFFPCRFL